MAATYGPLSAQLWKRALILPEFDDLFESIAEELGEFLGCGRQDAEAAMTAAWHAREAHARARFPSVVDATTLAQYYETDRNGLLVSAYWHSLRPDRYALASVAALHAVLLHSDGPAVLEIGHGIGSTGILFTMHDLNLTMADVSPEYRAFAQARFERRGLPTEFVDLTDSWPQSQFDAVISLDVVEHVIEPLRFIEQMAGALRPGGLLVLNIAFGLDPATPEHLLARRRGLLDRLRPLGLEPIPHPTLQVFWQRDQARWETPLRRAQDFVAVLGSDLGARFPRGRRVLRRSFMPPIP